MLNDLRHGIRMLFKSPGFTVVAVLSLALSIGGNTAIFSVIHAVLLRALPYKDPHRLTILWKTVPKKGIQQDWTSYPTFRDWKEQNHVFEDMALIFRPEAAQVTFTGSDPPERIHGAKVSANFFTVMGVSPAVGRSFSSEEEKRGDPVVMLSYGFWQRWFGSSVDAIGKTLGIDGRNSQVIGIMPASFQFPSKDTQLWLLNTSDSRWPQFTVIRLADAFCGVGRLRPGVTVREAQAEMSTIARHLEQQYPDTDAGLGIKVVPLHVHIAGSSLRRALWLLFGAVGFVLLIACANVANLLLVRGAMRRREMALRVALGASRWRLIRQLVAESVVLSLASGLLGLGIALLGIQALVAFGPANIPRLDETSFDPGVLAFTLGISVLSLLLFGVLPAWKASRISLNDSLKEGSRNATGAVGGNRTHGLLVVLEFALAVVLLAGTGLLVRSFLRIQRVDPGFRPERLLAMRIDLPDSLYEDEFKMSTTFLEQAIEKVERLPGVEAAAAGGIFSEYIPNVIVTVEGRPVPPGEHREQLTNHVISEGYFRVMGVPLLSGRFFSNQDRLNAPPVAIINETMVRRFWPGEDPMGKRFKYGVPGENLDWRTVIGVVGDMLPYGPESHAISIFYLPFRQLPWIPFTDFVVRTTSDPLQLVVAVRNEIQSINKTVPRLEMTTVEQQLRELGAPRRFQTRLLGLFSVVALLLAAIGIYGVISYSVAQRTHEIGIRMALGAQPGNVLSMVMRKGLRLALMGVGLGLIGALWLTEILSSYLYGVTATDPLTFGTVSVLLLAVAAAACYVPARRATKVDPMVALRYE